MTSPQYSIDVGEVTIYDEFWSPWIARNRKITIEYQYEQLETSGTLENFRRAADGADGGFSGMWFQDSDAYKWIEAASYELQKLNDADLRERLEEVTDLVAAAQEPSGYLNTYFQLVEPDNKWTNLHFMHELYCAGHLIEAAVAHHRATGENGMLEVATAFADHIDEVFGDEVDGVPGHEGIELALLRLYRVTDDERYLDLAEYFVGLRGHNDRLAWEINSLDSIGGGQYGAPQHEPGEDITKMGKNLFCEDGVYDGSYAQAHAPVSEQMSIEGHAVRAMYLYSGVTDLVAETSDDELREALDRIWKNMTTKRMYITGGIGSAHEHEGFTEDYDLPNETAYAETCAAIGSIFWNQRLFELTADPKYANLIERTLYNGFLAGVSMDGTEFFYINPLESEGDHHRKGWFTCACCPPNAARLFAALGQYLYSTIDDELYVNQYVGSTLETTVDGLDVALSQSSSIPWKGDVTFEIDADGSVTVHFRVPEWCTGFTITVDGKELDCDTDPSRGAITLNRAWNETQVSISFSQSLELVRANPEVESDAGRVAVKRGPLVYCAEAVDNDRPLHHYEIETPGDLRAEYQQDILDSLTIVEADAVVPDLDGWENRLYRSDDDVDWVSTRLRMIPYYAWDNRDAGQMKVWMRTSAQKSGTIGD
jgi:DUF1680 family protein